MIVLGPIQIMFIVEWWFIQCHRLEIVVSCCKVWTRWSHFRRRIWQTESISKIQPMSIIFGVDDKPECTTAWQPRMNWKMAALARAVISIIRILADQWSKLDLALSIWIEAPFVGDHWFHHYRLCYHCSMLSIDGSFFQLKSSTAREGSS
jgi:hypothetical protein